MRSKKSFKKKKSLQLSTLIWLTFFFFTMGFVVLPYLNTHSYDENNPPPPTFPIAVHAGMDMMHPIISSYYDFAQDADTSMLWQKDVQFPYQHLDGEFRKRTKSLYELTFKSEIFTVSYRYKVDEQARKVIPLSQKTSGWVIWFYALAYAIVATILITLGQWLRFWWKTSFTKD